MVGTWGLWKVYTVYWLADDVFSQYTGSSIYNFDWGEIIRWEKNNGKDPKTALLKKKRGILSKVLNQEKKQV